MDADRFRRVITYDDVMSLDMQFSHGANWIRLTTYFLMHHDPKAAFLGNVSSITRKKVKSAKSKSVSAGMCSEINLENTRFESLGE